MNLFRIAAAALLLGVIGCDTEGGNVPAGGSAPPAGGSAPAMTTDPAVTPTSPMPSNGNNTPTTSP